MNRHMGREGSGYAVEGDGIAIEGEGLAVEGGGVGVTRQDINPIFLP